MIIKSIAELCIQYDDQLSLVRVSWTAGPKMRGFQRAFMRLYGIIRRLEVGRVVLELDAMPDISVYDQLWMSNEFMPALARLPLRQVVVVQAARRIYNQHVVEGLLAAVASSLHFDVQFFTRPEAALAWITDYSARLPALLLEWADDCGSFAGSPDEVAEPPASYQR